MQIQKKMRTKFSQKFWRQWIQMKLGEKKPTAAKPAASGTGGARQRKNQNGAGNAAAHKCPSSDEVKLWSKFPLSSKSKVNIWRIAQHQLCMDRERAEVQHRPKTMHLGCPEIACKFDHI